MSATTTTTTTGPDEVHTCRHCGQPFLSADYHALHLGRRHDAGLTDEERARFTRAVAEEEAWLREFRRHVKGGLNALPAIVIYLAIHLMVYLAGIPIFFGFLLLPGVIAFAALLYYMQYVKDEAPPDTKREA